MISGVIITLNEERNIRECIQSMQRVCDEIIVVDSESTDKTVDLARESGANVIIQKYLGDGFQKNYGIDHVRNQWVLVLDADERLHEDLVQFIQNENLETTAAKAYAFRRRNLIGSRWIKHCGWYPDYCTRLFNRQEARFTEVKQHAKVTASEIKKINADIIHYSFKNIGELFSKPDRNFSTRAAKIMYLDGKRVGTSAPVIHGLNAFVRKYILQKGFLSGLDGLTVALSSGVNSYLKYAKLIELYNDDRVRKEQDFEKIW